MRHHNRKSPIGGVRLYVTLTIATSRNHLRTACVKFLLASCLLFAVSMNDARAHRWGEGYIPNVTVYNQDGKAFKFYDDLIHDKIVVVSFIYTTCRDICPLVTARLARVQDELGDTFGRDVHFISISIEPEKDTPEKLKAFASAFGVKPGWQFITGAPEDIAQIRYKLGERSRFPGEHKNGVLLGNDATGNWGHDSAMSDVDTLAMNIRGMDPNQPSIVSQSRGADTGRVVRESSMLPGQALFIKACSACHTVGRGDRVGPDLIDVGKRREHSWLVKFITEPSRMIASKDPTALSLLAAFKGRTMPNLGLSENDAADVLEYVEKRGDLIKAGLAAPRSAPNGGNAVKHPGVAPLKSSSVPSASGALN